VAKQRLTIWRVNTADENYSVHNSKYLVSGRSAAEAERKAINLAKADEDYQVRGDAKPKPYVTSIELVGELDA
jgi:hypothetical protein